MSMFDYDARPVTPGVVLVDTLASRGGYAIRDFLSRNGYPFEWVDAGQPDAVRAVLGVAELEPSPRLPGSAGNGRPVNCGTRPRLPVARMMSAWRTSATWSGKQHVGH